MNDMVNVTFIFKNRKMNDESNIDNFPKEHYYYFFEFKKKFTRNFIEEEKPNFLLRFSLKLFRKIFNRPIHLENYLNKKSLKILMDSRFVVTTNQNIFYTIYPLLFILKFFNKKMKMYTFVMGLNENYKFKNKQLANIFFKRIDCLFLFLKMKNFFMIHITQNSVKSLSMYLLALT